FHRWLIHTLMKQYLYTTIRPRTTGSPAAAFRTALKAVTWLTAQYSEEAARRKKDQRQMPALAEREAPGAGESAGAAGGAGLDIGGDQPSRSVSSKAERIPASGEAQLAERLSAE